MSTLPVYSNWTSAHSDVFWGEIARFDHVIQFYENDEFFLDALTGFVAGIIHSDENAIVIATDPHLTALESRMESLGMDVETLISTHKFIPFNADEILAEFTADDMPDQTLFTETIAGIFEKAGENKRKFRIFGEMVALLWQRGNKDAAMKLELLWDRLCRDNRFSLFCAYPEKLFSVAEINLTAELCCIHTKIISGSEKQMTRVHYRDIAAQVA